MRNGQSARRKIMRLAGLGAAAVYLFRAAFVSAQIYSLQTNQVIPGTENITPGPGVDLSNWNITGHTLEYAELRDVDLTGANFSNSDLTDATFFFSTLANANFAGATIQNVSFFATDLTAAQLYSTASYQAGNLTGIDISSDDLRGWNLANQNLTFANLESTLTNANLTGATIYGARIDPGMSPSQLYSTASYQNHDLTRVAFDGQFSGWSFVSQNLTSTNWLGAKVTNCDFTNAVITNADFEATNLSASQLYSTASYQSQTLKLQFPDDCTGWNFANQNLEGSGFWTSNVANANFTGATIDETQFKGALNFTANQLYSTASYQNRNLAGVSLPAMPGVDLSNQDLSSANLSTGNPFIGDYTGANFHNAKLFSTNFYGANLTNANFAGDDLTNANFGTANLTGANFTGAKFYMTSIFCTGANFSDADLRGATSWQSDNTMTTHDTILPSGLIMGLQMNAGELLTIRNNLIPVTVSAATVTFNGTSTLQFILDANWTSPMGFTVVHPIFFGILDLELATDAIPASLLGATFQLFEWNGTCPAGAFDTITTAPGLAWDTSQLYTAGMVTLIAIPEPTSAGLIAAAILPIIGRRRK